MVMKRWCCLLLLLVFAQDVHAQPQASSTRRLFRITALGAMVLPTRANGRCWDIGCFGKKKKMHKLTEALREIKDIVHWRKALVRKAFKFASTGTYLPDTFIIVKLNGRQILKTKRSSNSLMPMWGESAEAYVAPHDTLEVYAYDWDRFTSHDPMGFYATIGIPRKFLERGGIMKLKFGRIHELQLMLAPVHPEPREPPKAATARRAVPRPVLRDRPISRDAKPPERRSPEPRTKPDRRKALVRSVPPERRRVPEPRRREPPVRREVLARRKPPARRTTGEEPDDRDLAPPLPLPRERRVVPPESRQDNVPRRRPVEPRRSLPPARRVPDAPPKRLVARALPPGPKGSGIDGLYHLDKSKMLRLARYLEKNLHRLPKSRRAAVQQTIALALGMKMQLKLFGRNQAHLVTVHTVKGQLLRRLFYGTWSWHKKDVSFTMHVVEQSYRKKWRPLNLTVSCSVRRPRIRCVNIFGRKRHHDFLPAPH
ncbi:MAG: hypothetical protein EP343_18910 [Deltaproteobacteria bacterium]|nr:MAG: hypothetical protein EP343_18910 [Deltaproteobacteria bacterium]